VLLAGHLPFDDRNMSKLFHMVLSGSFKIPSTVSSSGKDLLEKMLKVKPEERITLNELRYHEWINIGLSPLNYYEIQEGEFVLGGEDLTWWSDNIFNQLKDLGFSEEEIGAALEDDQPGAVTAAAFLLKQKEEKEKKKQQSQSLQEKEKEQEKGGKKIQTIGNEHDPWPISHEINHKEIQTGYPKRSLDCQDDDEIDAEKKKDVKNSSSNTSSPHSNPSPLKHIILEENEDEREEVITESEIKPGIQQSQQQQPPLSVVIPSIENISSSVILDTNQTSKLSSVSSNPFTPRSTHSSDLDTSSIDYIETPSSYTSRTSSASTGSSYIYQSISPSSATIRSHQPSQSSSSPPYSSSSSSFSPSAGSSNNTDSRPSLLSKLRQSHGGQGGSNSMSSSSSTKTKGTTTVTTTPTTITTSTITTATNNSNSIKLKSATYQFPPSPTLLQSIITNLHHHQILITQETKKTDSILSMTCTSPNSTNSSNSNAIVDIMDSSSPEEAMERIIQDLYESDPEVSPVSSSSVPVLDEFEICVDDTHGLVQVNEIHIMTGFEDVVNKIVNGLQPQSQRPCISY